MTFSSLTPNLMVEDVAASVAFYRDLLGFELRAAVRDRAPVEGLPAAGDPPLDWALIGRDGVALMLQRRESLAGELPALAGVPLGASATFYMELDGVDALHDALKGKATVVRPPATTFYGRRELYVRDRDGYILALTEEAARP